MPFGKFQIIPKNIFRSTENFLRCKFKTVKANVETRIELISPELRKRMSSASETQLRRVATAVSRAIVERIGLENPIITGALEQLNNHPPTEDFRVKVQAFADELDSAYFDLSAECDEGRASREQVTTAFSKARAASAIAFAFSDDAIMAESEATYEAASATDDAAIILSVAEKILNGNAA